MSLRKKVLFLLGFFILAGLNLTLIGRSYAEHSRMLASDNILNEIAEHGNSSDKQFVSASAPFVLGAAVESNIEVGDARSANLRYFFRKYNSPLYEESEYIVGISDKYGFDYRLLPAIAMQESGLCKAIPKDSYNCWGYGIYGDQVWKFDSFREAIDEVAQGIKTNYIDHGLITPETIMAKYTPSSNGSWAHGVNWTLNEIK
jgi:hypothetical protein